jgi:hypothetical protein
MGLQLSAAQAEIADGSIEKANPFLQRAAEIDANYYRLHAIRGEIAKDQERDQDAVAGIQFAAIAHLPAEPAEGPLYGIQLHMDLMAVTRTSAMKPPLIMSLIRRKPRLTMAGRSGRQSAVPAPESSDQMNAGEFDAALGTSRKRLSSTRTIATICNSTGIS